MTTGVKHIVSENVRVDNNGWNRELTQRPAVGGEGATLVNSSDRLGQLARVKAPEESSDEVERGKFLWLIFEHAILPLRLLGLALHSVRIWLVENRDGYQNARS
jgi:hypothetical protein